MKITHFVILFLCIIFSAAAQENLLFGPSFSVPVGKFASDDVGEGGFAKPGWGLVFENKSRASLWPEAWAFLVHLSYHDNPFDNQALENAFNEAITAGTVQVQSGSYRPLILTLGPSYTIGLGEKVDLEFRGGLGVMFVNIDRIRIDVNDDTGTNLFTEVINFEGQPNFTYMLGTNVGFKVTRKSELGIGAHYASSNEGIDLLAGSGLTTLVETSQQINYVAFSLTYSILL